MKRKSLAIFFYFTGILWFKSTWLRVFGRKSYLILCYHRVNGGKNESCMFDWELIDANTEQFGMQMKFVSKHFNVSTFRELVEYSKKRKLPKNLLLITFDDGYKDNYTNAYPILKKYGLTATIFLTVDHIGSNNLFWWDKLAYIIKTTQEKELKLKTKEHTYCFKLTNEEEKKKSSVEINRLLKRMDNSQKEEMLRTLENSLDVAIDDSIARNLFLSWENIREMRKNGIEFGAHSLSHSILTNLLYKEIRKEVVASKIKIEDSLSERVIVFAYPNGCFDNLCKRVVTEAGFVGACSYQYGINDINSDMYELKRISMNNSVSQILFKSQLLFPKLMRIRRSRYDNDIAYQRNRWILNRISRKSFELYLFLNREFSKGAKLFHAMLKMPFGFLVIRLLLAKCITILTKEDSSWYPLDVMIPLLEEHMLSKWHRIFPWSQKKPPYLSFLIREGIRHTHYYVSSDRENILFIKSIRHRKLEYILEREYKNIRYLQKKLRGDLIKSIPRLCVLEKINGHSILILNYMSGKRMSELVSTYPSTRRGRLERDILKSLTWLVQFQKQTKFTKIKVGSLEPMAESLVSRYSHLFPYSDDVCRFFNNHIIYKIKQWEDLEIPLVCTHGDFFPNNILMEKHRIKVIDWADMEKKRLPTNDLFSFFLSFRIKNQKESKGILNDFRFVFFKKNWFSMLINRCFEWYCSTMNLDKRIVCLLFPLYLLRQAIFEVEQLHRNKIIRSNNLGEYLKFYVRNRKDFMLT